jgi:hypothetical protein
MSEKIICDYCGEETNDYKKTELDEIICQSCLEKECDFNRERGFIGDTACDFGYDGDGWD